MSGTRPDTSLILIDQVDHSIVDDDPLGDRILYKDESRTKCEESDEAVVTSTKMRNKRPASAKIRNRAKKHSDQVD